MLNLNQICEIIISVNKLKIIKCDILTITVFVDDIIKIRSDIKINIIIIQL